MSVRRRATNLSAFEKELLVEVALKYSHMVENKKTDSMSVRMKMEGWQIIANEFTAAGGQCREWAQLKNVSVWETLA